MRRRLPTVQTVSRKRKKLDPDDFLLEGKSAAKPGHQTATHWSSPNHSILCEQLFDYVFSLYFGVKYTADIHAAARCPV